MRRLQVELGARSYPIHIGAGLLDDGALLRELTGRHRVALVCDDTVAPLYAQRVAAALGRDDLLDLRIPAGEAHKTLATASTLMIAVHRITEALTTRFARALSPAPSAWPTMAPVA